MNMILGCSPAMVFSAVRARKAMMAFTLFIGYSCS
jgi:hypothetical protein